jgi:glycerate dehydrogenase
MCVFVRLRETLSLHKELAQNLNELERKIEGHDEHIRTLFEAIRQLAAPTEERELSATKENEMGFHVREESTPYRVSENHRSKIGTVPGVSGNRIFLSITFASCEQMRMGQTPRIVVLDGHTLNPGDLSWDEVRALGDCVLHERSAPNDLFDRLQDAHATLTNKVPLGRELLERLPDLRYIGVTATGFNIVDVEAARKQRIIVTNVPAYGTDSVAQTVFALLLELTHRVGHHAQTVRDGKWARCPDFTYQDFPLVELSGLTLGIVGYGRIAKKVAAIAEAFGMQILVARHRPNLESPYPTAETTDVFRRCDVLTLHCPLTPDTKGIVNAERLALMKRSAFLINTSRGPLIDEGALAEALNAGLIAGAGLDVLSVEPPPADHPLYRARNCLITPHYAWATKAARQRLMDVSAKNLAAFLAGSPQNVVS